MEKTEIVQKEVALIEDGDTIFPRNRDDGGAAGHPYSPSDPVFKHLYDKKTENFKFYLLGGDIHQVTEFFVGEITKIILEKIKFSKMFFSGNGVKDGEVMTSSFVEQLVIRNSLKNYLLMDTTKIGKEDFTTFCHLKDLITVITDSKRPEQLQKLQAFTEIIS